MTFQTSPPTSASGTERRSYGRIRLDEVASQELLLLLRNALAEIPHANTEPNKGRKRRIERMLSELHRMRQELGWE